MSYEATRLDHVDVVPHKPRGVSVCFMSPTQSPGAGYAVHAADAAACHVAADAARGLQDTAHALVVIVLILMSPSASSP